MRQGGMGKGAGDPPMGPQEHRLHRRPGERADLSADAPVPPRGLRGGELADGGHAAGRAVPGPVGPHSQPRLLRGLSAGHAGRGHWLPGDAGPQATITPDDRPGGIILQKGDNVSIIDPGTHRRTKGRIFSETATGTAQSRGARVQFQLLSPAFKTSPSPARSGQE